LRRAGTGEIEGCTNRLVTKCTARAGSVRVSPETFETRVNPDSKLAEDRDRRHQEEQGPDKRCARTIRASHHITSLGGQKAAQQTRSRSSWPTYQIGKTNRRRYSHHQYSARIELRVAGTYIHTRTPLGHRTQPNSHSPSCHSVDPCNLSSL
jgi:hypothetical protein